MRVAVGCTPATEAEVVALVTFLASVGRDDIEFVVPALDPEFTRGRVQSLFPEPVGVRLVVEPVHEYLERGHDLAALADDDPAVRGRQAAAVAGAAACPPVTPAEMVAWLARHTAMRAPDALRSRFTNGGSPLDRVSADRVIVRTRWGANLVGLTSQAEHSDLIVGGLYDPAALCAIEDALHDGDRAIDAAAGIGAVTVAMARFVGHRGHVAAREPDPAQHELLVENLELNGVGAWVNAASGWAAVDAELASNGEIAIIRTDDVNAADTLDRARAAIAGGRVRRLLLTLEPGELRSNATALADHLRDIRAQSSGSFGVIGPDGAPVPTTLDRILGSDEPLVVLADIPGAS